MSQVNITKEDPSKIKVVFPYNPTYLEKIKTLKGGWWHPREKYWTIPSKENTVGDENARFENFVAASFFKAAALT